MPILNGYGGEKAFRQAEAQRRILERKYHSGLQQMLHHMVGLVKSRKTPETIISAVEEYGKSKGFAGWISALAERMVTGALTGLRKTWREAASESTRGREIHKALKEESGRLGKTIDEILEENSALIKTVPRDLARKLSKLAYEQREKGLRPEETAKIMQKMAPDLTKGQIKRIARTETAKAGALLMEARCQDLGIKWYVWRSCQDERVRNSHAMMNGVYCRWSDPPNPEAMFGGHNSGGHYHPGGIYNCRCVALPVVDERDLRFPCRVYANGKVQSVPNIKTFKSIKG